VTTGDLEHPDGFSRAEMNVGLGDIGLQQKPNSRDEDNQAARAA
jgi:hypothetical protein